MGVRRALGLAALVSGAIVACSAGTGGPAASTGSSSDAQGFISQFCDIYAPCCAKVNQPTDGARCRSLYTSLLGDQQYDPAKGPACLSEERAASSNPDFCQNAGNMPSCKGTFREAGTQNKQPGEECLKDGDCVLPLDGTVRCATSYGSSGVQKKACQVQVDGKEGDAPCIGTRKGSTTSSSGTSIGGADGGVPAPPAKGFICDVGTGVYCQEKTGRCTKIQGVGGDCDTSNSYACDAAAFCDYTTKKCTARIEVGGDCSKSSSACVDQSYCDTTTRRCTAALADGSPCTTGEKCAGKSCVNGACAKASSDDFSTKLLCGG